jgi:hypothetical protein
MLLGKMLLGKTSLGKTSLGELTSYPVSYSKRFFSLLIILRRQNAEGQIADCQNVDFILPHVDIID